MQVKYQLKWAIVLLLAGIASVFFSGCQTTPPAVIAVTGTMFGVELSQNTATQSPQLKLGYNRAEVAIVNKEKFKEDVANVLMEFGYGGSTSNSIYQRLAVGEHAVQQTGASAMFLKDADGKLSSEAAKSLGQAIKNIPGD